MIKRMRKSNARRARHRFFWISLSVLIMTWYPAASVRASEDDPEISILVPDGPQPAGFEIPLILSLDRPWKTDLEISLESDYDNSGVQRIQPSAVIPAGEREKVVTLTRTQPGTVSIEARLPWNAGGGRAEAQLNIDSNPSIILARWGHGPAFCGDINGNLAVVGSGTVLRTIDVSAGQIQPLGEILLPKEILHVKLSDGLAIASVAGSSLFIIDISDPVHPLLLSSIPMPEWIRDLKVSGNRAAVLAGSLLCVVDISDPAHPVLLSSTGFCAWPWVVDGSLALGLCYGSPLKIVDLTTGASVSDLDLGNLQDVVASGGLAAVSSLDKIYIVELSIPTSPTLLATVDLERTRKLVMYGNQLYAQSTGPNSTITILDLNDPAHPSIISSVEDPSRGATLVEANEGVLLFKRREGIIGGFATVDTTDPGAPVLSSWYSSPGLGFGQLALSWPKALTADGRNGCSLLDFSNPNEPIRSDRLRTPGYLMDVAVVGDTAWAIDESGNLFGIDLSSGVPTTCGYCRLGGLPRSVKKLDNTHIVVANQAGRIQVLDVADPATAHIVGDLEFDSSGPFDLALLGANAYASADDGMHVIDLSDPSNPTDIGTGSSGIGNSLAIANPDTLIGSGSDLRIVDIRDPSHPQVGFRMDTSDDSGDVAADGDFVAAGEGRNIKRSRRTRIVNISNPEDPANVSVIEAPGHSPALFNGQLMIGGSAWAQFVDLSDPTNPTLAGMAWIGRGQGDLSANRRYLNIGGGSARYRDTILFAAGALGLAVLAAPDLSSHHSIAFEPENCTAVVGQPLNLRINISPGFDQAVSVELSSSPANIFESLPTLNIPAGVTSVDVPLMPVSASAPTLLEARVGKKPIFATADIVASRLSLSPHQLQMLEGEQETLELSLNPPLNQPTEVFLSSSNSDVVSVDSPLQIPAFATSVPIIAHAGAAGGPVRISASLPAQLGGESASSTLNVLEVVVPLSMQAATGDLPVGSARLLRLRLDRPRPDNIKLLLDSDRPDVAVVRPTQIVLPAGAVQASVSIIAVAPGAPTLVRATSPDDLVLPVQAIEVNVVPASQAPEMRVKGLIPFVADNPGSGSAQWTSDLWLYQDAAEESVIRFYPGGSGQGAESSRYLEVLVPKGEVVAVQDLLQATAGYWMDGIPYSSPATLLFDVEGIPASRMRIRSRTHAPADDGYGSKGLGVGGLMIDSLPTAGPEVVVPLPQAIPTYRVNLSCANPGAAEAEGTIRVYDRNREVLKNLDLNLPPGEIQEWLNVSTGIRESAAIASFSWTGPPLACSASWIDTRSGDPTYAPARPLLETAESLVAPALGRKEGIAVSWKSAFAVITDLPVSSIPLRRNQDDCSLELDSSFARWENDVIGDVFKLDEASMSLWVEDQYYNLEAWARGYADHGNEGTYGHRVPTLRTLLEDGDSVDLIGLTQNWQFRTNIGIVYIGHGSGYGSCADIELFDAVGKKLGKTEECAGASPIQLNSVFRNFTERQISGGRAHIRITGNMVHPSILVYASIIDTVTGDAVVVVP